MLQRILVCLLHAYLFSTVAYAAPLFTEDFNAEISIKGRHHQAQSGLPIKHGYDAMPGWTRLGDKMPAHFVESSSGDWALMVVANKVGTSKSGELPKAEFTRGAELPISYFLPNDPKIAAEASNAGKPFPVVGKRTPIVKTLRSAALALSGDRAAKERTSVLAKLFSRASKS